jgi:branched-chain amino acid transport system substrate-binding protein
MLKENTNSPNPPFIARRSSVLVRSKRNSFVFISLFATLALAMSWLSACTSQSSNTSGQAPIKIGASVPTTGDEAPDGANVKQGYELWAQNVNANGGLLGRQVELDFKSDNADPAQLTTNYTELINNDHVDLLLGSFDIDPNRAAAQVALRYGYPLIDPTSGTQDFYDLKLKNLFAVSLPVTRYLESYINFLQALPIAQRPKTIAIAGIDDPFAQSQITYARDLLKNSPSQIVVDEQPYQAETTDFNPPAQQIVNSKADAVIIGSLSIDECVGFIKAFKQQHYNPKAMICASGPDQGAAFTQPIGAATAEGIFVPNGEWFPTIKTYQNDVFTKTYLAKYGGTVEDISNDTVQAYTAGQVLQQAVEKINSIDHAKLIQELSTDTFDSIQGPVKFSLGGANTASVAYLYQWQNDQLVAVYPSSNAQANPEYPKKDWPTS